MKIKNLLAICVFLVMSGATTYAQKIKVDGNLKFLKDAKALNLEFTYDNMGVGKFKNGDDYVKETVAKKNSKDSGAGDKWKKAWIDNRENRFEPKFIELFSKYIAERGMKADKGLDNASIKVIVKTTFTEPGFNVGVVRKSASINADLVYIDTKTGKTLATMTVTKVPGRDAFGYDFDAGLRLQEAYAKLGKSVGKYILKSLK